MLLMFLSYQCIIGSIDVMSAQVIVYVRVQELTPRPRPPRLTYVCLPYLAVRVAPTPRHTHLVVLRFEAPRARGCAAMSMSPGNAFYRHYHREMPRGFCPFPRDLHSLHSHPEIPSVPIPIVRAKNVILVARCLYLAESTLSIDIQDV